jgi:hypothetical protein
MDKFNIHMQCPRISAGMCNAKDKCSLRLTHTHNDARCIARARAHTHTHTHTHQPPCLLARASLTHTRTPTFVRPFSRLPLFFPAWQPAVVTERGCLLVLSLVTYTPQWIQKPNCGLGASQPLDFSTRALLGTLSHFACCHFFFHHSRHSHQQPQSRAPLSCSARGPPPVPRIGRETLRHWRSDVTISFGPCQRH